jgi:hypothetical protein
MHELIIMQTFKVSMHTALIDFSSDYSRTGDRMMYLFIAGNAIYELLSPLESTTAAAAAAVTKRGTTHQLKASVRDSGSYSAASVRWRVASQILALSTRRSIRRSEWNNSTADWPMELGVTECNGIH